MDTSQRLVADTGLSVYCLLWLNDYTPLQHREAAIYCNMTIDSDCIFHLRFWMLPNPHYQKYIVTSLYQVSFIVYLCFIIHFAHSNSKIWLFLRNKSLLLFERLDYVILLWLRLLLLLKRTINNATHFIWFIFAYPCTWKCICIRDAPIDRLVTGIARFPRDRPWPATGRWVRHMPILCQS